jgi:hypothetical protein
MHHYKKYLCIAGVGALMLAAGVGMFLKEKHDGHRCCK